MSAERLFIQVSSTTHSPNRLIFNQKQLYALPVFKLHMVPFWFLVDRDIADFVIQTVDSVVLVEMDDRFKIRRLVDQWNGQMASSCWFASSFRRLFARIAPRIFPLPKD